MATSGHNQIERKFVVSDRSVIAAVTGTRLVQGYIVSRRDGSVRIRLTDAGTAFLTVKGPRFGSQRHELESSVPWYLGRQLLQLCEPHILIKTRHEVLENDVRWKVDEFHAANEGLLLAEAELDNPSTMLTIPAWCVREVTDQDQFYNEHLARQSYETTDWERVLGIPTVAAQPAVASYKEIERKFLVRDRSVIVGLSGTSMAQGYLIGGTGGSVRIRLTDSEVAILTVKSPRVGAERDEYESELNWPLGNHLLRLCEPNVITKMRYPRFENNVMWAIDVFQDANANLMLAEVELDNRNASLQVPRWLGREVTDDDRFYNEYLANHPYETWH